MMMQGLLIVMIKGFYRGLQEEENGGGFVKNRFKR